MAKHPRSLQREKLQTLAELEGFEHPEDMIEEASTDSVCPAICMNPGCDNTAEMEPDQDQGWCDECETGSMKSALMLAGVI